MSRIRADRYTNRLGTGAPLFSNGVNITGNVGVGTTVPTSKLTVVGNIDTTGIITAGSGIRVTGNGRLGIGTNNAGELLHMFSSNSDITLKIQTEGPLSPVILQFKSPSSGRIDFTPDTNSNASGRILYSHNTDSLTFSTKQPGGNRTDRVAITSEGYMTTPYQPHFTAVGHTGWVNLAPGDKVAFQDLTSNANLNNSNRSGGYNTTNSRFTAPVDGLYRFTVHMYFNSTNSGNVCSILPRVNGAQVNPGDVYFFFSVGGYTGDISANGSTCLYLSADDYVEVYKRDNNTGTNSYYSQHCWFQGQLVG